MLLTVPVWAQSAPPSNDDCQACHSDPEMKRADGRPVTVLPAHFQQSVHGQFACVDCHADLAKIAEFPHPDKLAPVDCATCHDEPAMQLASSVHARRPHGNGGPQVACVDCHGPPHRILPSDSPDSATNKFHIASTCGRCHGDDAKASTMRGPSVAGAFADSIHGQALSRAGLVVAPTCSDCHHSHAVLDKRAKESPVFRANVPATCGKCHAGIEHEYRDGIHSVALQGGDFTAPHCASCHTAHAIVRPETPERRLAAIQGCGTCHQEALHTYRDTFHGQVTQIGFVPVAKCVDCHQPHRIFGPQDPRSTVAPANLVATCGKCHTQANANFVKYQPHANRHDRARLPALYYAGRFMDGLLLGVFAFFGIHTALWFRRERSGPDDHGPEKGAPHG
jgi:nitrate/TMAO reductase-like tetraheme cytochrome c subunit